MVVAVVVTHGEVEEVAPGEEAVVGKPRRVRKEKRLKENSTQ